MPEFELTKAMVIAFAITVYCGWAGRKNNRILNLIPILIAIQVVNIFIPIYLDLVMTIAVLVYCIFITKDDHNIRWLYLLLLSILVVNIVIQPISLTWGDYYFLRCIAFDVLIIAAITMRKGIAHMISLLRLEPLRNIGLKYESSYNEMKHELAVVGIVTINIVVSLICFVEGRLYAFELIDTSPLRYHLFINWQWINTFLTMLLYLSMASNSKPRKNTKMVLKYE